MRDTPYSLRRCIGIGLLVTLEAMSAASSSRAACYSTPRAAIDALTASSASSSAPKNGGYKVTRVELDKVLGHRWAMVAPCNHPEWPITAFPADGVGWPSSPRMAQGYMAVGPETTPIVRAGDVVRLWKQESSLRIELAGVSQESGGVGKTIHVRLLHRNADDQSTSQQFSGVIRGPLDVEMQSR